jgi:predicted ATPase
LLIGKNGSGKTTISLALEILQKIARGTNRVKDLVKPKDFTRGRSDEPMRFVIEVVLDAVVYEYIIAFELPEEFKELRVLEEKLTDRLALGGAADNSGTDREGSSIHFQAMACSYTHPSANTRLD